MTAGDLASRRHAAAPTPDLRICIIALSAIADDPRVRRQAEAFHGAGWKVVAVGLAGARSAAPDWPILTRETQCEPPAPDRDPAIAMPSAAPEPRLGALLLAGDHAWLSAQSWSASERRIERYAGLARDVLQPFVRFAYRLRRILTYPVRLAFRVTNRFRHALRLLATRVRPAVAQDIYWAFSKNIQQIYDCAKRVDAQVWLANDWTMLPLAARLAREKGGIYGYDTHEFAAEEYGDQLKWRLWNRPMVCALERTFIRGAAVVSAVSPGIAERLDALYKLPRGCLVVRNTPPWEEVRFRAVGEQIRVLYHGIVAPGRGLEAAIDSAALWRPEFDLTIRGPGTESYLEALRARIERSGLIDRVRLEPPVPMTALVREAGAFDIGLFALPGSSWHNKFALPNKFFEYVMAGLALCVTDLPEMGHLMRRYDLGVTLPTIEPRAIAAGLNSLDRTRINALKRNALRAASELCWELECGHLLKAYQTAVAGNGAPV